MFVHPIISILHLHLFLHLRLALGRLFVLLLSLDLTLLQETVETYDLVPGANRLSLSVFVHFFIM